jgi:predicted lipoprotein with Yx(FWY)xxD motif
MRRRAVALAVIAGATLGACGSGGSNDDRSAATTADPPAPASTAPAAKEKPAATGSKVSVGSSDYGRILTDGKGRTLYLFTKESSGKTRCYGACADAWPPFYTRGKPRASGDARQSLLGTTRRSDGKQQVTYMGHPVYYYRSDVKPGQVLCQNVAEFGGTWLVVKPSGDAVR